VNGQWKAFQMLEMADAKLRTETLEHKGQTANLKSSEHWVVFFLLFDCLVKLHRWQYGQKHKTR